MSLASATRGRRAVLVAVSTLAFSVFITGPVHAELGCPPGAGADLSDLIDEISALPEGGWLRANLNRYEDVWTPADLRPSSGALLSTPSKIIQAWSGFAWDCRRGDLLLYGGGHANYSGNDTYRWRSSTRRWERMSLPSDIRVDGMGNTTAIDGPFAAPPAAHTYDNNVYLPFIDRFLVLGGSAWNNGGAYEMETGPDSERITGPYVFDLVKADAARVGGTTGSHVQRVSPRPEVVGGMMWDNRDHYSILPSASLPTNHTSGTSAYAGSGSSDVVLVTARTGFSTSQHLYRYEFTDADDASGDRVQRIGRFLTGVTGRGAGTFDPDLNVFVRTAIGSSAAVFYYWDLAAAGPNNPNVLFTPVDQSGGWALDRGYGMDFDPVRGQYLLWGGNADVWVLRAPALASPSGWTIERASPASSGETPISAYSGVGLESGGGVLGKWKYIPELDAFLGLQDTEAGNVWIYKPIGWTRPGTPRRPTLIISASPAQVFAGESVTVSWRAKDATTCIADGSWSGPRGLTGSYDVHDAPTGSAVFGLRCDGPAGTVHRSVAVSVLPLRPPTIGTISGDGCVNSAEITTGILVTGTGTAGATVVAELGSVVHSAPVGTSGQWSIGFSRAELAGLPEGSRAVAVHQRSAEGIASEPTIALFLKDTVAPTETTTAPRMLSASDTGSSNSDGLTRDATPTYQGVATAPGVSVSLMTDGVVSRTAKAAADGRWTATAMTLANGSHAVSAAVVDSCGNLGPLSPSLTPLTIDRISPALSLDRVAGDNRINAAESQATVTISGTSEAGAQISMAVLADGVQMLSRTLAVAGTQWALALSAADISSLPEATLKVAVSATDAAGNRRSITRSVAKDTSIVSPTIRPVSGDDVLTALERNSPVPLAGTAEPSAKVTIGFPGWSRLVSTSTGGTWSTELPAYVARSLPVGTISVSAVATDRAGNISSPSQRLVRVLSVD